MDIEIIIAETFSFPINSINDQLNLREIDIWDSMTHMILIARIEDNFEIQLSGDEIVDLKTIADIKQALQKRNKL